MEHIYSVSIPSPISHAKHYLENRDFRLITSISNSNILAFTSNLDLLDVSPKLLGNFIYVVDLNLPFYPYKVTESDQRITILEWNQKSTKLLVGKEGGEMEVWSIRNYLLSDWCKLHSQCISGDSILSGIWFHRGIKLSINYDKKDSNLLYQDKFSYTKIGASVVQFGNKHTDGYLYITSSGFVYAHVTLSHGKTITGCELLNKFRSKINLVDIAYMKNGSFLVIISNGNACLPFYCYKITISINYSENQKLNIVCEQFSSFTLNCSMNSPGMYPNVCFAKFIVKELPDSVLLVATGKTGSIIELWELREKNIQFHNIVQNMVQQNEVVDNLKEWCWQYTSCSTSTSHVTALATPRTTLFDLTPSPSYITVAYTDHTVKCFYREDFQMLVSIDLSEDCLGKENAFGSTSLFAQRTNPTNNVSTISDLALSWSSCVLVGLDSFSQLHVFRLSPVLEPCNPMSLNLAQILLEYSLLSGNDYWDVLISIKPQFVDSLCERITENFITRQTQTIQQKWLDSVLELKTSLFRSVISGPSTINYCKAGDCFAMKMLNAISETIKRQIRAREFQDGEGPIEKLALLVQNTQNDTQFVNIDKILPMLDNKDFYVELSTQQSFLSLMQWVCDLSLYLLASIPQQCHQNQYRLPGAGLIFDPSSINTIRELLVIIRFWSLIDNPFLPNFSKLLDNLDVIALIYKLLTKIVIALSEKNVEKKIDDSIIDECCVLPNHVVIPQMDLLPKAIGVASPSLYSSPNPMALQYGIEPKSFEYSFKLHSIEGAINLFDNRMVDILRYVALGSRARRSSNIRSCTRCNSASLMKPVTNKQYAARAWDYQWVKKCFCGGYWKIELPHN